MKPEIAELQRKILEIRETAKKEGRELSLSEIIAISQFKEDIEGLTE